MTNVPELQHKQLISVWPSHPYEEESQRSFSLPSSAKSFSVSFESVPPQFPPHRMPPRTMVMWKEHKKSVRLSISRYQSWQGWKICVPSVKGHYEGSHVPNHPDFRIPWGKGKSKKNPQIYRVPRFESCDEHCKSICQGLRHWGYGVLIIVPQKFDRAQ